MSYHPLFGPDVLSRSETAGRMGWDNSIPPALERDAKRLSAFLGELNAGFLGTWQKGLGVTSGYRNPKVNSVVGGAIGSDHMMCLAADIYVPGIANIELANKIIELCRAYNLDFQQVILEFNRWVHVSLPQHNRPGKKEILTAFKRPNHIGQMKTIYVPGIKERP